MDILNSDVREHWQNELVSSEHLSIYAYAVNEIKEEYTSILFILSNNIIEMYSKAHKSIRNYYFIEIQLYITTFFL